jgi:hypothetical protein
MPKPTVSLSFAVIILLSATAFAQEPPPTVRPPSTPTPPTPSTPGAKVWSFYTSIFGYIVPDDRSYASPTITADRGALHLEGRYNYENLETGSVWIGRNFSFGKKVEVEVTPMIGGVFGKSNGVAPGYLASLSSRKFTIDSQGEYLFDTQRSASFFYNWSEASYSPVEWLRAGIVIQRTKAYQTSLDTQRGLLVGVYYKRLDFTTYVFNLGWTDPTTVLALGFQF